MAAVCRQASQGSRAHWDLLLSAPDPRLPTCCLPSVLSSRKQLEGSYEAWHPLFPSPADLQVCELWGMKQQVPCDLSPEVSSSTVGPVAQAGVLQGCRALSPKGLSLTWGRRQSLTGTEVAWGSLGPSPLRLPYPALWTGRLSQQLVLQSSLEA